MEKGDLSYHRKSRRKEAGGWDRSLKTNEQNQIKKASRAYIKTY